MTFYSVNGSDGLLSRVAVGLLMFAALCGFARDGIKVYRVAKEPASAQPLPAGHPELSAPGVVPEPKLTFKTPDGWNEVPPGKMRVASFNVKSKDGKQADVSVVPLGGLAGGDLANVNRWRVQQLGSESVSADELKTLAEKVEVAGQPADLDDLAGKNPASGEAARVLGIIQHRGGTAWFFKMSGDAELVAQQKPTFVAFAKSCKFETQVAAAVPPSSLPADREALPPSHPPLEGGALPANHPDLSATPPATTPALSREGQPNWQVPSGWKEVAGGQFLVAKFDVPGEGGAKAAVNVSASAGEGGGLLANVNRWRQMQLGLPAATEADLAKISFPVELTSGKATLVDLAGTDVRSKQPARIVGVIVPQSGQTWFYKLMGDPTVVEAQKDAFIKFIQTVKY